MRSTSRGSRHVPKARGTAATAIAAATAASALLAATGTALADPYVGVKFRGNATGVTIEPTESTGLVPQSNWNHANGNNGSGIFLNDASGAPATISMSYAAQEAWSTGVAATSPTNKLFGGYLSAQNSQASTISLANVPVGFYDLVLYTMRDDAGSPQSRYANSASGVVYRTNHDWRDNYNANPTYRQATSTNPNARQTGNYVRWDGLPVVGSLGITFTADNFRAPVNGFQLLTSTKPVKTWSGQASSVWDTTSPNFSGQTFQQGDNLFFKDTNATGGAVTNRNVTLSTGGANPAGIIVDSSGDYTFNGALRNAGLAKAGAGTLTLTGAGDNGGLGISAVNAGTVLLDKQSSLDVRAVGSIANVAAGATVRITGTGGNQITDTGDVTNMNGTLDLGGQSERFGTLSGSGTVARTAAAATLTVGSGATGSFTGTIQNTATLNLVKEGAGRQALTNVNFAGPVTVNDGIFELSGNGRVSGPSITLNSSGTRATYPYANAAQTRLGALALTNMSVDPVGATPVILNGGEVIHNSNGAIKAYTLQNATANSGLNTFSNQPSGGARPLTLGSLTRTRGATIEFKSNFGTLGGTGDNGQVKITNLNGVPFAGNTNGMIGGWAIAYNGDGSPWDSYWASYDPATGVRPFTGTYVETLTGVTAADNVRVSSPNVVSANTTVNSLVARNDNAVTINSGVTLKVDSGGVIITYGNNNQVGGAGDITTGLPSGELFLHAYDSAFAQDNDRFNLNARIVDNGGTPTTVIKSGYGTLTLGGGNVHTGGIIVNAGMLTLRNNGAAGSGPITVAPGAQLTLGQNTSVNNPITLNGISPNGALRSRAGGGGSQSYYNGTITLARTSNVGSSTIDDIFVIPGKITGPGGLTVATGKVVLANTTNDYAGDTTVDLGALFWASDPFGNGRIPSGAGKGNVIVNGTLDLASSPQTINGLLGEGVVTNEYFDPTTLTVGAGNASSLFPGTIKSGDAFGATIDLVKTGTGTITLSGANNPGGTTTVNAGTLGFATPAALYGGNTGSWTADRIVVNPGATLAIGVGPGGFNTGQLDTIKAIGTATGGFRNGSNLGIDTTAGNLSYGSVIANTNGGANAIGLVKSGPNTLTLTAANTYTGGTTVSGGTLAVANVGALGTGGLAVANGATARAVPGLPIALNLPGQPAMTASGPTGGTLDLTDNALVVRHANQSAALAGHATINGLVRNAFNEFQWNQPGVTSSNVAADVANGIPAALGILLNNDGGGNALFYGNGTDLPQFEGRSVDANSVLTKATLLGDGDLNGTVDSVDFALFQAGYTGAAPYVGFAFGDYDYNGVIDSVDFGLFQAGYQYSGSSATPEMVAFAGDHHLSLVAAAVPEPATLGVLALGAVGLLGRRRRRHAVTRRHEGMCN